MNQELEAYVKRCLKIELKWMYHYEVDDEDFGIETDKCRVCRMLIDGYPVELAIEYFEKNYGKDEKHFIERLKELSS